MNSGYYCNGFNNDCIDGSWFNNVCMYYKRGFHPLWWIVMDISNMLNMCFNISNILLKLNLPYYSNCFRDIYLLIIFII